jgi:hypothetical protein
MLCCTATICQGAAWHALETCRQHLTRRLIAVLQATLMALFSLCRRLCTRLQVGSGWRQSFMFHYFSPCARWPTACYRGQASDLRLWHIHLCKHT